jgi:hypothetical protein
LKNTPPHEGISADIHSRKKLEKEGWKKGTMGMKGNKEERK